MQKTSDRPSDKLKLKLQQLVCPKKFDNILKELEDHTEEQHSSKSIESSAQDAAVIAKDDSHLYSKMKSQLRSK
jgi:hypothetical protein